ncbi:hypothetical protein FBD94_02925 [Pedobacter hiemivivus]|uniref:Uncharacterized protein n=1 Tax=Pedobacter hiemivivus TaxID=2530454 RepID=A0A4R0N7D3_9SPHI|nr:hypothetical protein [Pedobacter hiemivivus]TCC96008.1 hypothetical protein EZ444_13225 [Pedobacter hiemivivus]TKC65519.1 hypothetical protein FBD94_02925 [Pedobacter hiemivivus]
MMTELDMKPLQAVSSITVGFTWHAITKEVWFSDNDRDQMGDDVPFCELNKTHKASMYLGYRIFTAANSKTHSWCETFASGWLDEATQEFWSRPVDVLLLKNRSMLVSDDFAGVIYRIS